MTIHQCPKCELRFDWKTELDDHCWHDHPEFRHEYPAVHLAEATEEPIAGTPAPPVEHHPHIGTSSFTDWLRPTRPARPHAEDDQRQPPQ